jgi:uncharacterized protein (TIGR02597 family)
MKTSFKFLALLSGAAVFSASTIFAVTTDPVGYVTVAFPADTDTNTAMPLARPAVYSGEINSISGSVITLKGTPSFTASEFVYSSEVQPNYYYAIVTSGAVDLAGQPTSSSLEGSVFPITENDTGAITLDLGGMSLADLDEASVDGIGDTIRIAPYWSLGTLFSDGGSLDPSPSFTPVTSILFADNDSAGINLASSATYFYYSGTAAGGPGWRKVGSAPTIVFDDQPLSPDSYFTVRNSSANPASLVVAGNVPVTAFRTILNSIADNIPQDNFISLAMPTDVTLAESQLVESGAFIGSSSFTPVDTLLVFDSAATGLNKSTSSTFFYYTGTVAGGSGWRKVGSAPTLIFDNDAVLKAGEGFIIRKAAQPSAGSLSWAITPPYSSSL